MKTDNDLTSQGYKPNRSDTLNQFMGIHNITDKDVIYEDDEGVDFMMHKPGYNKLENDMRNFSYNKKDDTYGPNNYSAINKINKYKDKTNRYDKILANKPVNENHARELYDLETGDYRKGVRDKSHGKISDDHLMQIIEDRYGSIEEFVDYMKKINYNF